MTEKTGRFNFGKVASATDVLNSDENIIASYSDSDGGYSARDNFGNVRLVREGIDPSFEYQKRYKIQTYEDGGEHKAFVSITNDAAVDKLVLAWEKPTQKMLDIRKSMSKEGEDGSWKVNEYERSLIDEWKQTSLSIASGNNVGGYISYSGETPKMNKFASVKLEESTPEIEAAVKNKHFLERQQNIEEIRNLKSGMVITCGQCKNSGITMDMNFCPHCGHKFSE